MLGEACPINSSDGGAGTLKGDCPFGELNIVLLHRNPAFSRRKDSSASSCCSRTGDPVLPLSSDAAPELAFVSTPVSPGSAIADTRQKHEGTASSELPAY